MPPPPPAESVLIVLGLFLLTISASHGFLSANIIESRSGSAVCLVGTKVALSSSEVITETTPRDSKEQTPSTDLNFAQHEEKEAKELEWLVETTFQVLGSLIDGSSEPSSPPSSQHQQQQSSSSSRKTLRLMKSWSNRASKPDSKAPHVVERLLQKLVQDQETSSSSSTIVGTHHYNIVLQAWSRSSEKGAAERCEQILALMEAASIEEEQERIALPNQQDNKIECDDNTRSHHTGPNCISYNYLISSYIRLLTSDQTRTKEDSQVILDKIEKVFERMKNDPLVPDPNRETYNFILLAYSSCSGRLMCGQKAEQLLREMQTSQTVQPDVNSYNNLLGAWTKEYSQNPEFVFSKVLSLLDEIMDPLSDIEPNADIFNHVLGIWLKRSDKEPVLPPMLQLFGEMKDAYYQDKNEACKPDLVTMNTILSAMVKTQQHQRADEISLRKSNVSFDVMTVEDLIQFRNQTEDEFVIQPDTITYNILMNSWCKSTDRRSEAPEQVMLLYTEMTNEEKRTNRRLVDAYTYNCMIDCFIKVHLSDAPQKAEELLEI
jgi:hypothetical protein